MLVSSTHQQGRQVKDDARHTRLRPCSNLCLILFDVACDPPGRPDAPELRCFTVHALMLSTLPDL